jgi:putative PIG3 family NAD(P)H quinone oxidoreductase
VRALTIPSGPSIPPGPSGDRNAGLVVAERPDPVPGPGEVLVRVHGAGLNRADLAQAAGRYPAPAGSPADVPGLEFAGIVVGLGAGVSSPALGARVFGIAGGGAQAELLTVPAGQCAPVPERLDLVAAGGVPETFVTAHDAMVTQSALQRGETMLVHAIGSGVGTSALQLGKAMGATVVGTSRDRDKLGQARALGLDHGVLSGDELDPAALAEEITAAAGPVDVVLELVGGGYVETDVRAAAYQGRIVLIGTLAGGRSTLDVGAVMFKRLRVFGTMLRGRDAREKAAATAAFVDDVVPLLASGAVSPVVARTFTLDDAPEAYDLLAADSVFGKIILDLS